MPYEPLHHKYRPQTFAELVGQEAIATTLINALRQQKIAPAYLFTGARGTGKTSSARILAKSLNCLQSETPTAQPCGKCEVCRSIANGSALDVIEIDAASNTGVDNIRELIERAQFAPVQCRYKVYVIDECHMLSTAAFNALLKTLEEPPVHVVFILATTDPQRVLPTIISRCQRFDYRRIPLEAMVQHLGLIAEQEAIDITPAAIQLVAQIAQGGLRDAESMLDQLSLLPDQITPDRVWDLVGAVPEKDLLALVQAIAQDDPIMVLDRARQLMDRGREPLIVLQNLTSFYRDLLIAKTSPQRQDLVAITPPTWQVMCEFVQSLDVSLILSGQQHLRASETQIKQSTQPRLWLEVALMGLLPSAQASLPVAAVPAPVKPQRSAAPIPVVPAPSQSPTPAALPPKSASSPKAAVTPEPVPQPEPVVSVVAPVSSRASKPEPQPELSEPPSLASTPAPVVEQPDLQQIWEEVLTLVQPISTQVMLRQQCLLLGFDQQQAKIGARSQQLFKMAQQRLPNVEAAFAQLCDRPIRVSLEVVTSTPPAPPSPAPAPAATAAAVPSRTPKAVVRETAPASPSSFSGDRTAAPAAKSTPPPADYPAESAISPAPVLPTTWEAEDEVSRSAKALAQFFNGQVVSLEADEQPLSATDLSRLQTDMDLEEADGDPDHDVPF